MKNQNKNIDQVVGPLLGDRLFTHMASTGPNYHLIELGKGYSSFPPTDTTTICSMIRYNLVSLIARSSGMQVADRLKVFFVPRPEIRGPKTGVIVARLDTSGKEWVLPWSVEYVDGIIDDLIIQIRSKLDGHVLMFAERNYRHLVVDIHPSDFVGCVMNLNHSKSSWVEILFPELKPARTFKEYLERME